MSDKVFTVKSAAKFLGVSEWAVRSAMRKGLLAYYRYGSHMVRIQLEDLLKYQESCRRGGVEELKVAPTPSPKTVAGLRRHGII